MNRVISTVICDTPVTLMLQSGFFRHFTSPSPPHRHRYCEIHAVYGGVIEYTVEGCRYCVGSGSLIMIPAEEKHSCDRLETGTGHCSFLLDIQPKKTVQIAVPEAMIQKLMQAASESAESGNYREVIGCISYFFSLLFSDIRILSRPLRDDVLIISDYIEKNYANEPSLAALAGELRLSIKQTARLVQRYMGSTFWDEITKRRMETAGQLLSEGKMNKRQIAEYVGYRSYSGFYKAREQYEKKGRDEAR